MYGAIEAGGTKFVCAIGEADGTIHERVVIPTTTPEETIGQIHTFFHEKKLEAIGIGSFGPIDVNRDSDTYGWITSTPKTAWKNYPFVQVMEEAYGIPIGFTTDVNAAALGEATLGAAKGLDSCLYLTVGTGIGGGAVVNGELLQGYSHPEMGHLLIRRHPEDHFQGTCPYHKDCLEGLAAGPAIEQRWGKKGSALENETAVWELEGYYLAQALLSYMLILSPKRIVLGGGVSHQEAVFHSICHHLPALNKGYIPLPDLDTTIVRPALGNDSGIAGALLLAHREKNKS